DFVRVRAHTTKPCCAEMVNGRGEVLRVIEDNAYDAGVRVRECDSCGVTMQILSPTPMMIPDFVDNANDAAAICAILNDDNARLVAQFPTRFMALGAVPMAHPDHAVREMERIRRDHNMRGIEINSNVNGLDLDDPRFFPVFEAAAQMNMAVFIHPWGGFMSPSEPALKARMNANRNWRPWLAGMPMETALAFDSLCRGRVHERLPHLRVLYAHGAGVLPAILGRMEHGSYCRPDLFASSSQMDPYETVRTCGVYADTLVHSPFAFAGLLGTMGAGRIALGSDYPYPLGEMELPGTDGIYPGHMIEHLPGLDTDMKAAWPHFDWINPARLDGTHAELPRLDDAQCQRILSGTAREWLGV
ncbi:MAG: amidohydrolase, partial [Alphaproteobacteria bacterium]|nr:amidohydrolase [Alphaproteobacteria bacterium]